MIVEADCRRRGAVNLENELEKSRAEIATRRIACEDDIRRGDWLMQGTRGRVKKREICEERIQEGCREGCLWGKAVANGEAAATSTTCKFGSERTVRRGIT